VSKLEWASELEPEMLFLGNGGEFDEAFVGVCCQHGRPPIALYDRQKVLDIFVADGCSEEEAIEHFECNVIGAWVGEFTPAFAVFYKEEIDDSKTNE
jgi:hypothetical protein